VCSTCLRCKSCGTADVTLFVGNLPLCKSCFKLRQKGNYCPLCQRCYEDDDYDTKMMECGRCKCWVHAKCEGLSDEKYQVLSYLPDSVEFVCRMCCSIPPAPWWLAVEEELKAGYLSVLKSLSKNRKACAMLKWSPKKQCLCRPSLVAKRLDFQEISDRETETDDQSDSAREDKTGFQFNKKNVTSDSTKECFCLDQHMLAKPSPTLLSVKKKVNCNEYSSLLQFHQEMEQLIARAQCPDLLETYHHTLKEIFPWFDPKYARVSSSWKETRPGHEEVATCNSTRMEVNQSHFEQVSPMGINIKTEDPCDVVPECITDQNVDYYYSGYTVTDLRTCTLCKGVGDGIPVEEGRLLYCGQNEWIHANCALWSAEVFEEIDGSLQNVHSAVSRGRMIRCRSCGKKGASVGCCARNCNETFHFPCARRIGCAFMDDKTVFCATHLLEVHGKPLHLDVEFDIRRPIYVELDRKKKKFAEPNQVKFMIGSLSVENLGEFVPASDNPEIIVPSDFQCTRLYWSSVEPWRIVRYYVKTTVQTAEPAIVVDLGKNLTVDHTQEQKLKMTENKRIAVKSVEEKVARQVMDHLLDAVCSKDVDDSCLADPQTTADLLPPELKDAIFEDLPHDLLDGISMQDIFPKLMSYEDLAAVDVKNDACFNTDGSKEDMNEVVMLGSEVEPVSSCEQMLKGRRHEHSLPEIGSQGSVQKTNARELKRSKSEVIPQSVTKKIASSGRSHQRSCSLTWSCKLDGTLTSAAKRRKGTRTVSRGGGESASSLVMVVDTLARPGTPSIPSSVAETVRELKCRLEEETASSESTSASRRKSTHQKEEGKENKCLLWHGRPQTRILQLDGAADSCSSSGSEGAACKNLNNSFADRVVSEEEPVRCDRCHRTYRTRSSFERHLPTCSSDFILSTSESDSENTRSSEEEGSKKPKFSSNSRSSTRSPSLELENESKEEDGNSENLKNLSLVSPSNSPQPVSTQPLPKIAQSSQKVHTINGRPRSRPSPKTPSQRSSVKKENPTTPLVNVSPTSVPCQQPTVIMQQVPSPNMVPAFVEAFQQQTGQSLQYIATIDTHNNGYSKTPYLTTAPNSLVPGAFQLQTPDGYVGLPNGGISVLPGVQLAPPQPAVIGTLIHQTPPATIQCVAAEQVVLGSTPAIEMFTDQTGGMYLTSQPMYYGLETIVSNTVMSSSQFVSAAIPGMMAASSSFSATTTQVFQASKLVEPIVDVPSSFSCTSMNVPSQAQPPVMTPPIQNVQQWSYNEFNNAENYMPPSNDMEHFSSNASQNVRSYISPVNPLCSPSTPPVPVPAPSPQTTIPCPPSVSRSISSIPPAISLPAQISASVSPAAQKMQHKNVERIRVSVATSTCASQVQNSSAVNVKTLKPGNLVDGPVRSINRVFSVETIEQGTNRNMCTPDRVTFIPIPQNKNGNNNSNKQSNSLKLVFQKQAQDGYYKISNQNPHSKLIDSSKSGALSNQPLAVRTVKIKPRMVNVSEKQKDSYNVTAPVLQTDSKMNTQNGTHIQNGKVPPFQEKNMLGKNTAPTITYEVHSQDGFKCTSSSITEVWQKVFEAVQQAREMHKMPRLPENPFSANSAGLQMLGFRHNALRYLVEQLPGVGRCIKYKPRYHKLRPPCHEDDVDALPLENTSGCARCEPFNKRSPYDMFSWLASRHRKPPKFIVSSEGESSSNRRATSSNLPMAMRFRHLKETSKEAVGVYRSNIHGRGLFCLRDIEAGEMVIEYAGEVIRSMLTDKREKYYESKDIGCYMFRIDDQLVVDATMRGNAARFINHSCEPNCYSRVVDILGKKHILIFALRRIPQGEELTYDYKFPFEDVKIPCTCGSRKCRKYLN
ncbi:hypothetical protein L9F63_012128, partial [Diploptera punctata]